MKQLKFKRISTAIFGTYKFIVYEYPLANLSRRWENPYHVYSECYRNKDAPLLEEFLDDIDPEEGFTFPLTMEEVNKRIEDGNLFYVAKKSGKIIGYCWYLVNKVIIPEFEATIYLNTDEVCSINSYIHPEFRGKGIRNYMRAYEYNELMRNGYKRSVTYVSNNNKASLRMHRKWGSIQIGIVKRINILTFSFHHTDLRTNEIVFHGGPFLIWKRLYHFIKNHYLFRRAS